MGSSAVGVLHVSLTSNLAHWDLGEDTWILDWERGGKGNRHSFPLYKGLGARLERAIYTYVGWTWKRRAIRKSSHLAMVNHDSMFGVLVNIQNSRKILVRLSYSNYVYIPTAEVPLTNYAVMKSLMVETCQSASLLWVIHPSWSWFCWSYTRGFDSFCTNSTRLKWLNLPNQKNLTKNWKNDSQCWKHPSKTPTFHTVSLLSLLEI